MKHVQEASEYFSVLPVASARDQEFISDDILVDVGGPTLLGIEGAFWDGGDTFALDAVGRRQDLDAVAEASDGFASGGDGLDGAAEILVIADVFWSSATRNESTGIIGRIEVAESDARLEVVARPFLRDVPGNIGIGRDLVEYGVVKTGLWSCDDNFEVVLGESIVGVEGVEGFRGVTNGHQDLGLH